MEGTLHLYRGAMWGYCLYSAKVESGYLVLKGSNQIKIQVEKVITEG